MRRGTPAFSSAHRGTSTRPSECDRWLSRRGFLKAAAATSAVGAVAVGTRAEAAPAFKDKREKITVYLSSYQRIGKSSMRAQRLVVFTKDKKLASWLRNYREQRQVRDALMKVVGKAKEEVLYDGKKLYALERKLGAVVAAQYKKRKKLRVAQPDVMLHVSYYYRRRLMGKMPSPRWRPHP